VETIVVVGGNRSVAKYLSEFNNGVYVLHHDAHVKTKQSQRKFESMVSKADRILVMVDACSHQGMWGARTIAKEKGIPICYNRGLGVSGFLQEHQEQALC